MNPSIEIPIALEAARKRTRFSVLGLLACCVAVILVQGFADPDPPPDRVWTTVAVLLALATIVMSRIAAAPATNPRNAIWLSLASLVACASLGLLGAFVAWIGEAPRTGILFTLAGVIFAIRPTTSAGSRRGRH